MAVSSVVKNFRDGTILIEDGTTPTPISLTVQYEAGDFSITGLNQSNTEATTYLDRGELGSVRKTSRTFPTFSFSAHMTDLSDATDKLLWDAVNKTGAFASAGGCAGFNAAGRSGGRGVSFFCAGRSSSRGSSLTTRGGGCSTIRSISSPLKRSIISRTRDPFAARPSTTMAEPVRTVRCTSRRPNSCAAIRPTARGGIGAARRGA